MPALTETLHGTTDEEHGHAAIEVTITVSADTDRASERLIDEMAKQVMGTGETPIIWQREPVAVICPPVRFKHIDWTV